MEFDVERAFSELYANVAEIVTNGNPKTLFDTMNMSKRLEDIIYTLQQKNKELKLEILKEECNND